MVDKAKLDQMFSNLGRYLGMLHALAGVPREAFLENPDKIGNAKYHLVVAVETTKHIDKGALVVTYCDGVGCNASTKGALNMLKLGFRVRELIGGLDWWKRDGHKTHAGAVPDRSVTCGCG